MSELRFPLLLAFVAPCDIPFFADIGREYTCVLSLFTLGTVVVIKMNNTCRVFYLLSQPFLI